jgi:hypothetical protein
VRTSYSSARLPLQDPSDLHLLDMEPSRDKDCGGGDDGEPENPRTVGEKEACYESLKRAAGTSALSLRLVSVREVQR